MQPGPVTAPWRTILLAALLLPGCGGAGASAAADPPLVVAAASLVDVLSELSARPGAPPFAWTVAGSEHVVRSVALGAPGDVIVIARRLTEAERGLGTGAVAVCATRLVLACEASRARPPTSWADLLARDPPWRLAVADPDVGPAGRYARDALAAAGAGAAVLDRLLVAGTVREACQLALQGPADGVLCYRSDTAALPELVAAFDAGGGAVVYEGLVTAPTARRAPAAALLAWLAGPDARPAFARRGFEPPP